MNSKHEALRRIEAHRNCIRRGSKKAAQHYLSIWSLIQKYGLNPGVDFGSCAGNTGLLAEAKRMQEFFELKENGFETTEES